MAFVRRIAFSAKSLNPLFSVSVSVLNTSGLISRRLSSVICNNNNRLAVSPLLCSPKSAIPLFSQMTKRGAKTRVNKSAKKRFRVTANSGLKAGHAGRRHLNRNKTRKVMNNKRKDMHLTGANLRNMRMLLKMGNY